MNTTMTPNITGASFARPRCSRSVSCVAALTAVNGNGYAPTTGISGFGDMGQHETTQDATWSKRLTPGSLSEVTT